MADTHDSPHRATRASGVTARAVPRLLLAVMTALALMLALALAVAPMPAHAVTRTTARGTSVSASTTKGSLTIDAVWDRDGSGRKPLVGDTYSIVRVVSVDLASNGTITAFHTLDAFKRFDRDWASLTSSQLNDVAKELRDYADKHKLYEHSGVTGADGRVTFKGLTVGLYLVARTAVAKANTAYTCDPFLVAIPDIADLGVTVEPKYGGGDDVNPPGPDNPDNPNNPDNPSNPNNPGDNPGNPSNPGGSNGSGGSFIPNGLKHTAVTGTDIAGFGMLTVAIGVAGVVLRHLRRRRTSAADGGSGAAPGADDGVNDGPGVSNDTGAVAVKP